MRAKKIIPSTIFSTRSFVRHYLICALLWLTLSAAAARGESGALLAAAVGAVYGLFTLLAYAALAEWLDKSSRTRAKNSRLVVLLGVKLAVLSMLLALTIRATSFEIYFGLAGFFLSPLTALMWERHSTR